MSDDALRRLASKAGIALHWTDQTGAEREVSAPSLRAILAAMGLSAGSDADLRDSTVLVDTAEMPAGAALFATARVGQPVRLPLPVPAGTLVEAMLENGTRSSLRTEEGADGAPMLPAFAEPGYHKVTTPGGEITIATAPDRCVTVADLTGGEPCWGLAAQIYSLRSAGDGGIGHFGAVAALGQSAARLGADALAISPVHALYGVAPDHFSPYSPSTRLFYNPLHADPALALDDPRWADLVAAEAATMMELEALPQVDWLRATPLKQAVLRRLYEQARDEGASWWTEFAAFRDTASPLLRAHATFEVLHAHHVAGGPGGWDWRRWPEEHRDPDHPGASAFAARNADAVAFQIFMQWLAGRSCATAHRLCREAGMAIGLIADLAIGMDGAGSHAWSRQTEILHGLSVGAPPDYYAAEGQSWGLTTFSPRGLATSGFAPFIETLRASFRHAGGIRIDHVMGLSRLWLVPEGASAIEGAYVSFPSEAMFRLVALESWRHKAIVIGEDLGTLPDGFREDLRGQGVAGLRVLRFERRGDRYLPPHQWDPDAAALTTTHDLVPTAGWWTGADLEGPAEDSEPHAVRAWDRGLLWSAFAEAGLVEGDRPADWDAEPVVEAAIRFVATTPCRLKLLSLEDALAVETQPNVPGTTTEKPNWRHRLPGQAGELLDGEATCRRLRHLAPPRAKEGTG